MLSILRNPEHNNAPESEIPSSWYLYVEDEVLNNLINTRSVLNKIKSFCDETPWHREFKDRA